VFRPGRKYVPSEEVLEMGGEVIAVAISKLDKAAVFVVDEFDGWGSGFEVGRPSLPQRPSSEICPVLAGFGNPGFDLSSSVEERDRSGPHEGTSEEAILGKPGALVCAAAIRGDVEGGLFGARELNHPIHVADRGRQTGQLQCTIERPPGGIDASGVVERLSCLPKDALQP